MKKYKGIVGVELIYHRGILAKVEIKKSSVDLITWEALRHDIPFYEEQLDKTKWICLQ